MPPLGLARAFGIARVEPHNSNLLATLLDPSRHRGAEAMLGVFLGKVAGQPHLDDSFSTSLREIAEEPWEEVVVRREHFRIDVVVEISCTQRSVVIGIEHKIGAGEGDRQIARYQEALESFYPDDWLTVIVFLSPNGRDPATARDDGPVPWVALGYDVVLTAVREARSRAAPGSHEDRVLSEVAAHIEEDILGDPEAEAKALVNELWKDHGHALRLALEHRPKMENIREQYVELLREHFGDDAKFDYFHQGGLKEIKMGLSSWEEKRLPFTFMFYGHGARRLPHVRVLLWWEAYNELAQSLAEWAREVNAAGGPPIDEEFTHRELGESMAESLLRGGLSSRGSFGGGDV